MGERRLQELELSLPSIPEAAGNYIPSVRVGNLLVLGGNIGLIEGELQYTGKVGQDVTLEEAYQMARNCGLNHLAAIKEALGSLDRVERAVKLVGYVNAAPDFQDLPKVVNGASDLLVEIWGDRGRHARAAIGVATLGWNAPVETELTVEIREGIATRRPGLRES